MGKKSLFVSLLIILIVVFAAFYFIKSNSPNAERTGSSYTKLGTVQSDPETKPLDVERSVTMAAVGDVLIHSTVYNKAKTAKGYDFKPMFKAVKPIIEKADIAVANSESMIGGTEIGLSTYPSFNSPYEVGDAMKDAGFDVVNMANNHTLDRGQVAIENAIKHWDKIGMVHTGSFLSEKERNEIETVKKNGITFSFLGYTYGTNGIPTPEGKDYLVNRIDLDLIKKDVEAAKKVSDVVVVMLHYGSEYQRMPNQSQIDLVQHLANYGVDIIFGTHPHVLQPIAWVNGKDGHKTFVAYSLGNFLSGQNEIYTEIGGILQIKVTKQVTNDKMTIEITEPEFTPTWVDQGNYHIVPLDTADENGLSRAPTLYKEITQHMAHWIPKVEF